MWKVLVKNLITCLFQLLHIGSGVKVAGTMVYKSSMKGIKGNKVLLEGGTFACSSLYMEGKNNSFESKGKLRCADISVYGENNQILFEDIKIEKAHIVVRGSNCCVSIKKGTSFGDVYMVCMGNHNYIEIGEECMFAEKIDIWNTDSHPIFNKDGDLANPSAPIVIGNHVWIGKGCRILKGVTIGNNSIVGMGALVTKDIPSSTLNVGMPSKVIKENINWDRRFINE